MNEFLDVARRAAYQAGESLLSNQQKAMKIGYKGKGRKNPFSQADKEAEEIIINTISDAFPEHSFISEETGKRGTTSEYTWVIDPLDGTINFIHKHTHFAVSVCLSHREDILLGVIYSPVMGEMFTAIKGNGAYLNDTRIHVSETTRLDESLLSIGFPYDRNSEAFRRSLKTFTKLVKDSQALRRDGSTALALGNVACGRYDGFCVAGNELWDYAAGILIVAEAGGKVTDFKGDAIQLDNTKGEVVATNGKIHDLILKYCQDDCSV